MSKQVSFMSALQCTGYGIAGMGIARGLHEIGHDVQFHDISRSQMMGTTYFGSSADAGVLTTLCEKSSIFGYDIPCVKMWHQFDLSLWMGRGRKIGWPIFELDKFNEKELHHLKFPDELIVCSKWAQEVIKKEVDRDSSVVPLGVDPSIFSPDDKRERDKDKPFIFTNIGKWEVRKGHDVLCDMYNLAFREDDNVQLHVLAPMWADAKEKRDWMEYYKNSPMGHTMHFIDRKANHADVAQVMRDCDCGVFPARAEGWNMELLEMMSVGRPVIALGYGAQLEYCTQDNCHIVDVDNTELAYDGKWFHGQGSWAEIGDKQQQQFADYMRAIYEDWKFNEAGVATAHEFSWTNAAKKLADLL